VILIKILSNLKKGFIKNTVKLKVNRVIPIEHLEKRDWELWLLAILIILCLTLFLVVNYVEELSGSPREYFKKLISVNIYLTGLVILILMFCAYALAKNLELQRLRKAFFNQREELERVSHTLGEVTAFLRIGSEIIAKKDLDTILEIIVQEATNCLRGNRCSIFLQGKESGILKTQYRYAPHALDEQVCLFEEKEIVRKVLRQEKVSLLREPEDFADFFNYAARERKITSLMVAPLLVSGRTIGAISMALIDADRKFSEGDIDCLYAFGHQASIAIENSKRQEEVFGEGGFRQRYERFLDDLFYWLQTLSREDNQHLMESLVNMVPFRSMDEKQTFLSLVGENSGGWKEPVILTGEICFDRREDERVSHALKVELENDFLAKSLNVSVVGAFVETPNPLEVGEKFPLKLHLPDSKEPLELTCKVIWTNKYGEERKDLKRGMGVKFLNLQSEAKRRIEGFIRMRRSRQAHLTGGGEQEKKPKTDMSPEFQSRT